MFELALAILIVAAVAIYVFKKQIIQFLLKVRSKHQMQSLRTAIHNADKDKSRTGRKNMVVYNSTTRTFEPVQKKLLKQVARVNKRKKQKSSINTNRIKLIEKKSLYVTR